MFTGMSVVWQILHKHTGLWRIFRLFLISFSVYKVATNFMTFSGLLCLAILGDNFQNINKEAILESVRCSQKEDGSFWSEGYGSESDMRFVFCAVAICHILQDNSYINWTSLKKFVRSSLNYDGGIGQGPGDESHGGSTFCAIASLSLSNRLWDGSILSRNEISRLVKWALWKQNHGFHGRAHKDDDSCYAFWIGATLEILNASHLMDQRELRSFLLTAQHQPLGGFCKVPDPAGFPDLLHTYFSLAAFSLLREPGFSPIHASLNLLYYCIHLQTSDMILLAPADLDQEETAFRIITHLKRFQQAADSLFDRTVARIDDLNVACQGLQSRMEAVSRKVSVLREMNAAGVLTCLSSFPPIDYTPAKDLLVPAPATPEKPIFKPKTPSFCVADIRRELQERKRFYIISHSNKSNAVDLSTDKRTLRRTAMFADMFYSDTDELAFGKKSYKNAGSGNREKPKNDSCVPTSCPTSNKDEIEIAAINSRLGSITDPLDYVPESGPIEDLDLPFILPDLPGVAEDPIMLDYDIVPSEFLHNSHAPIPDVSNDLKSETTNADNLETNANAEKSEKTADIDLDEVLAETPSLPSRKSPPIPMEVPTPPPPAPPPPPPPPSLLSPVPSTSRPSSLPNNERADLMAAIRAAGGASKAKLRNVGSSRRSVKDKESLSSSALSEKTSFPGNSLMVSLAKALEARRKAISGMNAQASTTTEMNYDGIGSTDRRTDDVDDEWK
ncbi:prenyltransferase and squalene oxidase repeat-containing domain protein [Necator americanus]|uniref:Prenyltransferase and squalene oxidase repeat-containing domain protein n=1 Tax=Necator americanus TaxID=51031 RepID=W2SYV5_NECAM|nr:prenyltransferase and squalene oxidase repeat-containing domain protein [Necator americanus]ETN74860.1 prenyltransferase and squalene oxidase repeat-containing domain protein [Necator americanus]